jgi:hypothetical protein
MQKYKTGVLLLLAVYLSSCGISRHVSEIQMLAEEAFEMNEYETALAHYEEIISLKTARGQDVDGRIYYAAGISAWETGDTGKTVDYLRQAHNNGFATEASYFALSGAYREIDNLSLEISHLEGYADKYPDGARIDQVRIRLFEVYIESNNDIAAIELWPEIEKHAREDARLLEKYFLLNKKLKHENRLEGIAKKLLDLDGENIHAIEYFAESNFWEAENRYQDEMKAYEKNRTAGQYRKLLAALEEINEKFKISRDYFERLFAKEPSSRYATYLMNIYIRFGNEERAEFYRKRAQ